MEHKLVNWLKFATMSMKISLSTQAIANLDQHNWNCSIFKIFFLCISLAYSIPFLLSMRLSYLGKQLWYDLRTANISRTKRSNPLSVMFWSKLQRFECEVNNIQIWHFISCLENITPVVLGTLRSLSMQRFWATRGNRKWTFFRPGHWSLPDFQTNRFY